jgi:TonB-dependent receptor
MSNNYLGRTRRLGAGVSVIAVAAALSAMPGGALAQATSTGVEVITVTGFRSSLEKSLQAKRNSTTAIDSISAEDIAKFPDLNLGEAVQRVPGVALQRDGGEGRNISVRGLGPTFTRILVDGMEAQATTGGTDASGGDNRNRQFDFNVFAPDLFSNITVQKTQASETEEGSLGATVNLGMRHPFDDPGYHIAFGAKEGYNDLAKKYAPRFSGVISNTFMDGKFGALLGIAYTKRELIEEGTSTVRWNNDISVANQFYQSVGGTGATTPTTVSGIPTGGDTCTNAITDTLAPAGDCAAANTAYHPRFPRFDKYIDDQTRRSGALSLQFQPWDNTLFTVDALYADYAATREEMFLEAPSFSVTGNCTTGAGTEASPRNATNSCGLRATDLLAGSTVVDTGIPFFGTPPAGYVGTTVKELVRGTFDDVDLRVEHRFDKLDTKFRQLTWTGKHDFSSRFGIDGLVGYSTSKHQNPIQTTFTWDQFDVDGFSYDYTHGRVPLINWGTANLTDPSTWILTQIRLRPQSTFNSFKTILGNVHWDAFDAVHFKAGFDFKRYSFTTTEARRVAPVVNGHVYPLGSAGPCSAVITANQENCIPAANEAIPTSSYSQLLQFSGSGLGSPAGNVNAWVVPDYNRGVALMNLYNATIFPTSITTQIGSNRGVKEDDFGVFGQADFSSSFYGVPMRGNIGLRSITTRQTSTGLSSFTPPGGTVQIVSTTVKRSYTDNLPSLNLVFEPADNFLIRIGAAKVMARPGLGSLTPGATVSVSGATRTVSVQNPLIQPFRAKTFDAAFEWYFTKESLMSAAFFYKDITSLVSTSSQTIPFHGNPFGLPDELAIAACGATVGCDASTAFTFSAAVNTPGGQLGGVELTYQQPFSFLPWFFKNFGMQANYTYIQSSVAYAVGSTGTFVKNDLANLSRKTYNWTLYYDDGRWFEARVSTSSRSKYLTGVPGTEAGTNVDGTNKTYNVDASATLNLTSQFAITFEAVNLTDQFQDQFNDSANFVSFYHHTGSDYFLGARFKY